MQCWLSLLGANTALGRSTAGGGSIIGRGPTTLSLRQLEHRPATGQFPIRRSALLRDQEWQARRDASRRFPSEPDAGVLALHGWTRRQFNLVPGSSFYCGKSPADADRARLAWGSGGTVSSEPSPVIAGLGWRIANRRMTKTLLFDAYG